MLRDYPLGKIVKGIFIGEDHCYPNDSVCIPGVYQPYVEEVLLSAGFLKDRTEKLAYEIFKHYSSTAELHLICCLKGANRFFGELIQSLRTIHRLTPCTENDNHVYIEHFVEAKSYRNMESSGIVRINKTPSEMEAICKGRDILLVEDLVDTGATLAELHKQCETAGARSVRVVCLFSKRVPGWTGFEPDFIGFDLPMKYIVGYGMDYNDMFRDLDPLCCINAKAEELFKKTD